MKVLGLDSTAGVAAIAITDNGRILAQHTVDSGNTHSTSLLPMIESSMKIIGLSPSDIDLYAVSAGPGSFTGVRIGAATVKGLAFASDTPCIGVSSLEAMAENLAFLPGIVCPVINARHSEVFTAIFRCSSGQAPERLTEDCAMLISELCGKLEEYDCDIYFTGDAAELCEAEFKGSNLKQTPILLKRQNAVGVCSLGSRKYLSSSEEEKEKMTAEALIPIYLKKPQAEREREERLAAENTVH